MEIIGMSEMAEVSRRWYPPRKYCELPEALWRLDITPVHWELLRATNEVPAARTRWGKDTWDREELEHWFGLLRHVYFLEMTDFIKIGFSATLENRMESFKSSMPYPVKLLHSIAGSTKTERFLHEKFAGLRGRGEWFARSEEILQYIEALRT